ncbi:hypothetical protein DFJ58DRAFT_743197 [Suillus subalutaceus]|uniref:uncharacterized protein n=1 Tax=Suillus subalutaceus TaxID=48586 RepID=UPI001B8848CD|nr:uncharacterized protein DFJ58DRAFT_743197 [Suillus subalutaceus]KAG1865849.1 hypothetical protein DFJ58DRAFT_743197 [Suillus subalutaceus]
MPTFFVQPAQPTALSDKYEVELPGYELWATMIQNVHVLVGSLDVKKFSAALSRTLQLWPHTAGRLTNDGGKYKAIEFEERPHESTSSVVLDSHVIQNDLSGLLNSPHQRSAFDFEVPLLRLKVVSFRDETTLGISWNHILGDATAFFRFTHAFSQFYQGLHLVYPSPTFEKPIFPEPSECTIEELRPSICYLHELCSEEVLCKKYSQRVHTSERVNWFFERHELETLCNSLRQRSPSAATRLSIHDSLSAYIVTVINRILPNQIRKIKFMDSYRFSGASFAFPDVAGNAIIEALTALPENPTDITGIATSIRETLTHYRQHEVISTWMSVASHLMLAAAKARKLFYYPPTEIIIDWCSAHFGQPESHRHHMSGHGLLYLRVFGANPWRGDDGSWHAPEGRIDISIGVPQGYRQKVLDILAQGLDSIKKDG